MWTIYSRQGALAQVEPDPFVFSATLEQHVFFSTPIRTCVLWCVVNSDVCMGANVLDSDIWDATRIEGQWRLVEGGKLTLLASASQPSADPPLLGPQWFVEACSFAAPSSSLGFPRPLRGTLESSSNS